MTTTFHKNRPGSCATLLLFVLAFTIQAFGQATTSINTSAEEQTIRNLVAQANTGKQLPYTDDRIFVSGAYPKPMIGKEMILENKAAEERIQKERLNFKANNRIQRLEIAQASDMAYEFGFADLKWDTPEQKHVAIEASYLRVWRKINGAWKVDVFFGRPNEPVQPK